MRRQKNIALGVEFLEKSIDPATNGSRAFYSRALYPTKGWSAPYPETTGYIITTFIKLSQKHKEYEYLFEKARKMGDWIVSIQNSDGSLPGGLYKPNSDNKSIFNSAQMIKGLVALYDTTGEKKYLDSAHAAAAWITKSQDEDGSWSKHAYQQSFSPSYYTRVAWPMLLVSERTNDKEIENAAKKALDFIVSRKLPNSFIDQTGFVPDSYAFLHTIAYTLEGFIDAAIITGNKDYWNAGYDLAEVLLKKFEIKKYLAGAYYPDLKEVAWYTCLTGHAQMAVVWLKIFKENNDPRFVNAASKILDYVGSKQHKMSTPLFQKGGLTGSFPFWGRYITLRQPNWAVKFYLDAILLEEEAYATIEETVA